MSNYLSPQDLAGEVCFQPNFFQTKPRINYLINHYLSLEKEEILSQLFLFSPLFLSCRLALGEVSSPSSDRLSYPSLEFIYARDAMKSAFTTQV